MNRQHARTADLGRVSPGTLYPCLSALSVVLVIMMVLPLLLACETHPGASRMLSPPNGGDMSGVFDDQDVAAPPPDAELVPAIIGPPPDPSVEQLTYRIGPYDDLRVDVFGVPELSAEGQVNLQGLLALPLIGPVPVNGLTPEEAERAIEANLGGRYLRNPKVTVYVVNSASLNVTIVGAVGSQGVHPIRGRKTLMDIFAQAGGVSPVGKKRQVVLYRANENNQTQAYVIDYQKILDGQMRDPLIVGDDKIYVPPSGLAVFFSPLMNVFQTWVWPYRPTP